MQVTRFPDPRSFLARAEPFLLRAEAENNLMRGIAGMASFFGEDAITFSIHEKLEHPITAPNE